MLYNLDNIAIYIILKILLQKYLGEILQKKQIVFNL